MRTALGCFAVGALTMGALWGGLSACGGSVTTGSSSNGGSGASESTASPGGTTSSGGTASSGGTTSSGGTSATSGGGTTGSDTTGTSGGGGVVVPFDWHDARLYSVDVDRFSDGDPANDFGSPAPIPQASAYQGGDWLGLRQKTEEGYFTDLGVNALLLTIPMNNADVGELGSNGHWYSAYMGYWPSDLEAAEEHFGTIADLKDAVDAAHTKGIRVIVRFEPRDVHTSAQVHVDHPGWFTPECICGVDCDWNVDGQVCWLAPFLPTFDLTVPDARDYVLDRAVDWLLQTGVDGLDVEAVGNIPPSFLTALRQRIAQDVEPITGQHVFLSGEVFTSDPSMFVDPATLLDGTVMLPLRAAIVQAVLMRQGTMATLGAALESYHATWGSGWQRITVGDLYYPRPIGFAQDVPLWNNAWDGGSSQAWMNQPGLPNGPTAFERLGVAFEVLFTISGIPEIHAGDEIGLPGAGQPDNTRRMPWAGLTQHQIDLRARVSVLAGVRAAHEALRRGDFTLLGSTNDTLAYSRVYGADKMVIALNRSDVEQSPSILPPGNYVDLASGETISGPTVLLQPRSARMLTPVN